MWGAIIGAGISAAGSLFSSWQANKNANKLASNAVQTRVKDMREAGLNPVLAAGQTGAAAVPNQQTADFSSAGKIYSDYTARKAQKNQEFNNTRQTDSNIALQSTQAASTAADVKVKAATEQNLKEQNLLLREQALTQQASRGLMAAQSGLASANQVRTQYQATQDRVLSEYFNTPEGAERVRTNFSGNTTLGLLDTLQRRYSESTSSAKDVYRNNGNTFLSPLEKQQAMEYLKRRFFESRRKSSETIYPINSWNR